MAKLPKVSELTKHEQALRTAEWNGRERGRMEARLELENSRKEQEAKLIAHRNALHLQTLKEITQLTSVFGQMIGEVARAMQSEKDQL